MNYVQTLKRYMHLEQIAVESEVQKLKCKIRWTMNTFELLKMDPLTYSIKV